MSKATSVVRKLFVLLLGEGAARVLGVITFAMLARALGLADLGVFSFGMSLALVLECVMDFGQTAHVGRTVAEDPDTGLPRFRLAASNKVIIAAGLGAIAAAAMLLADFSTREILIVVLLVVWAAGLSVLDSLRSAARSLGRFSLDSTANGAESLGRALAVALVWALGGSLTHFGLVFALESWFAALVVWTILGKHHPRLLSPPAGGVDLRRFLSEAAPFGIAVMSLSAFYHLDQVFVRTLVGAEANGLYATAARVSFTASVGGSLLALVVYPDLARIKDDVRRFGSYMRKAVALAAFIGVVAGSIIFFAARPLLVLLFGTEFAPAAPLLRILAIVVVFRGVSSVALYAANALGRSRQVAVVAVVFAVANVLANAILLPKGGAVAAAWISGVGEFALAVTLLMVSFSYIRSAIQPTGQG